jgi:HPt (histidine-containing phosphotransfer) domain-containing protein
MDVKALSENIGIDVETYVEILGMFYERTLEDMDIIQSALQEGKSDAAVRGAHSIKGAAANLGIEDISELAKEIEFKARDSMLNEIPVLMTPLREKVRLVKNVLP